MSYSTALKSFFYGCSSFFAGLDAGWLWLAAPPTSRNARLLPLWFRKPSRLRAKMAPEWESPAFVVHSPLSQDGGQRRRPAGAQFPNLLQRVCIQPVPRKRQPPTPHNLTSAFPSYLHPFNIQVIHLSVSGDFSCEFSQIRLSWLNWSISPRSLSKGWDWEFQSFPNSHGPLGRFRSSTNEVLQYTEKALWRNHLHIGISVIISEAFPPDKYVFFMVSQRWLGSDPITATFLQVCQMAYPVPQVEFTQVRRNEQSASVFLMPPKGCDKNRVQSAAPFWLPFSTTWENVT